MSEAKIIKKGDNLYLVKYALTAGIELVEADEDQYHDDMIIVVGRPAQIFKLGRDVFKDGSAAVRAAEAQRIVKIKSLEKQIAKLKLLKFSDHA